MHILTQIIEVKKDEVSKLKKKYTLNSFREMEFFGTDCLQFSEKIKKNDGISIIAEIKKASPSKGIIREDFNHLNIAEIYFKEEADAVSILTDNIFFKGSIDFISDIAKIKQAPLLRKDFIIDEYQIFEAKAYGSDMILLICEVLSKNQIIDLTHAANECGMEVLLELHSEKQLKKVDFKLNKLLGINNRNLEDFTVNLETTINISEKIPDDVILISESGIKQRDDIKFLFEADIDGVLVGEHLMAAKDIKSKFKELKEWCFIES